MIIGLASVIIAFMINYTIDQNSEGQRADRFLQKFFPEASKGFLQKMLRKKRIKRNHARLEANTMLKAGDILTFYFSDETYHRFRGTKTDEQTPDLTKALPLLDMMNYPVMETGSLLVLNKPAGWLTQPDDSGKISVADVVKILGPKHDTFHPAPANRLDYGTSGIILVPKDYDTQKKLLTAIRDHRVQKEYLVLVEGKITESGDIQGSLKKNSTSNRVKADAAGKPASLNYTPVYTTDDFTLLKVRLITGRSHQIRVQLANIGHPVIGDYKYGNGSLNRKLEAAVSSLPLMLHSYHYAAPDLNIDVTAPLSKDFKTVLKAVGIKKRQF